MSFVSLSPLPTGRSNVPSSALEGKALLGSLSFAKNNSCFILNNKGNGRPCATVGGRLTSAEGDCKDCKRQLSFFSQKRSRLVNIRAKGNSTTGGRSENAEQPGKPTVEKSKKILSLQKELLEQITKRKKLIATLKENIEKSSPSNQSNGSSEETFDETYDEESSYGADSGVDLPSLPQSEFLTPSIPLPKLDPKSPQTDSSRAPGSSSVVVPAQPLVPVMPKSHGLEKPPRLVVAEMKKETLKVHAAEAEKDGTTAEVVVKSPPPAGDNVMNIVVVAAECAPWSKTGGLGDVAGALPKALAQRGHRVMVVAPRYSDYKEAFELGAGKRYSVAGQDFEVRYFQAYIDGVDYVFVDSPLFSHLGNNIYGGNREDILKRMVLLCKVAVEVPWHVPCGGVCYGDSNLVFIANDWHTALLPVYLQAYYRDNGLMHYARSILVIHNIAHQGRGPLSDFRLLDLPEHYLDKFRLYDNVGGEHMNIFKAGLMAAHRIVAVSHGYAWECQTKEGGWGLDGIIQDNTWKLCGIVNGIDDKDWNPELDVFLKGDGYVNYGLDSLMTGKAACKAALQRELGLPVRADVPLVGFIGRLDHQKGVDIIAEAMPWITSQDLQLVMLGSGRADLEGLLRSFEGQYRDKVRGWVGFCVRTAHRITAGVDILLMPSRFEPCGLNQLYAMKYGTVPVVHAVGGLRDTVAQFDPYNNSGTGWTFGSANAAAMQDALGLALWTYRDFKKSWNAIQMRGMAQDLSWDNAAKQYEQALLKAKYQW